MDHDGSLVERDEGNTKLSRSPLARYWCFTLNNYSKEELDHIIEICKKGSIEFEIGEEVGIEGTPHLQGFIQAPNRIRASETFKNKRIHWEKCKGSEKKNVNYCSKEGKYWASPKLLAKITKDPMDGKEPYAFQKKILDLIQTTPDDRSLYWFWEFEGCTGKTTIAKHICMKYNAIYVSGKSDDIKCAIVNYVQINGKGPDIVIWGLPRSKEDYINYASFEEVKDGIFFSGKYESGMCIFNTPHCIALANFEPDKKKLSNDRWVIECVGNASSDNDCWPEDSSNGL